MFDARKNQTIFGAFFRFLEVVYHATVYNVRKTDKNAIVGLLKSCMQAAIMLVVFYVMLNLMGGKAMAVRGDYFLFLLSGILLFMTHVKTVNAVSGAEGPNAPLMQHAPMNSLVAIFGAALSTLYTQVLAVFVVLTIYHLLMAPVQIEEPAKAFAMLLLAWYSGVGVGWCMLAVRPYAPGFVNTFKMLYTRINMFASGKMMTANSLPYFMLPIFIWNPLFHAIDQARGYIFINYEPHFTSWQYAFWLSTALVAIGFIGEGYIRQKLTVGWSSNAN